VLQERGKGNAGTSYGPFGDLYVTVRVVPDPDPDPVPVPPGAPSVPPAPAGAWVAGRRVSLDVGLGEAVLGGRVTLVLPGGEVDVVVPPGTSSGAQLRLVGMDEGGGDLLVELRIVVPAPIDAESRRLIEAFVQRNPSR
nr:hypothetical protein [Deltaproteobacteria bacterium]